MLSWIVLSSLDYWICLICLATAQNKKKIHSKDVVDVSRMGGVSELVLAEEEEGYLPGEDWGEG